MVGVTITFYFTGQRGGGGVGEGGGGGQFVKVQNKLGPATGPRVQRVSSGVATGRATLTSLFTPVKIDGDPSGQTCEGGEEEERGREEQECDKKQATN